MILDDFGVSRPGKKEEVVIPKKEKNDVGVTERGVQRTSSNADTA